jgi:hypothetical protein
MCCLVRTIIHLWKAVMEEYGAMMNGGLQREHKELAENLLQCHFIYSECHSKLPGINSSLNGEYPASNCIN